MTRALLRDLADVMLRDLIRPSRMKLAVLVILVVLSVVAENGGHLVLGEPGENPVAIAIIVLSVKVATGLMRDG